MIIEQIDKGYYIILDLDEYYLEHKTCYKKQFFPHISFIFGYDVVRKIFVTSGYDEHGIYRTMEYSFSNIQRAFLHANCRYLECVQANKSYRFQYSPDTLAKDIEAYLFGETLKDYYEKKVLLDYDYWEFDFCGEIKMGIFAQKTLLDLLNNSLKVECKKENGLDLRNFRVLMEHKNILCESLRFASYNIGMPSTIAERYRTDVKDMAAILFYLAIKFNVSYKKTAFKNE